MDSELDIDIDDPNQLLSLLKNKLDPEDNRTVTSLIQNIVVGTALIDEETRSYMLSMIEKAVMYIVLDQNGITNFTDAFKYSVDQIISGLQEIESLQEENMQLTAICDHQEKQLLNQTNGQDDATERIAAPISFNNIGEEQLLLHKENLSRIYRAFQNFSPVRLASGASPRLELQKLSASPVSEIPPVLNTDLNHSLTPTLGKPPPPPPPPMNGIFLLTRGSSSSTTRWNSSSTIDDAQYYTHAAS